jgi:peptide/nickel transport system substrate-binding protein
MLSRNTRYVLLIVALVTALLAASLPAMGQGDNTLIFARAVDATGLDPHTQTTFASLDMLKMVYEPLVINDHNMDIAPGLAESWQFSDDAMTLTFQLRQGVKFHDGSDFTAEDVIASYERILDEETASAGRTNYLSIESMEAPDDYTVVFNLSTPDVPLLSAMTNINAAIMSADFIANNDPAAEAVGTGPFMLESWVPEETTTFKANPDWWGEGPFIDGVEMRIIPDEASILAALRAGTIDFADLQDPLIATLVENEEGITLHRSPVLDYHVMQLRASVEPLDKLEVRQAISCALDRQEVVDTAALGEGMVTGPLTMANLALPLDELFCYEQDQDKARELLAQAGLPDGFTFSSVIVLPTSIPNAENIQAQLAEVGIIMEIEPMEQSVFVNRWLEADFDVAITRNGGRTDPYTMYSRYWQYDARFQDVAGYIDDELDQLMKAGQTETDPEVRYEIFADLQRQLVEKSPWIWLYTGYGYTAALDTVEGWNPGANDMFYFLHEVTLNR